MSEPCGCWGNIVPAGASRKIKIDEKRHVSCAIGIHRVAHKRIRFVFLSNLLLIGKSTWGFYLHPRTTGGKPKWKKLNKFSNQLVLSKMGNNFTMWWKAMELIMRQAFGNNSLHWKLFPSTELPLLASELNEFLRCSKQLAWIIQDKLELNIYFMSFELYRSLKLSWRHYEVKSNLKCIFHWTVGEGISWIL